MIRNILKVLFRIFVAVLVVVSSAGARPAAPEAPGEYEVKAAFLYNILSFVEWPRPANRNAGTMRFCMLGASGAADALDGLNGQAVMGRTLEVVRVTSFIDAAPCSILFIGSSEERNIRRIMRSLQGTNILSVGDTAGFGRQGVIINFYLEQKKVRFEVNAAAARQAGLVISSKLLKLAGAVYGAVPAGE